MLTGINEYYSTEEYRIDVGEDKKFNIVEEIKKYAVNKGYKVITIDGVRVEFDDAWALIRASNTGPLISARFEAKTKDRLDSIENEFMGILKKTAN